MCEDSNHNYTFLRQLTEEVTWHNFVTKDIFYCTKCLNHKEIEVPKRDKRW